MQNQTQSKSLRTATDKTNTIAYYDRYAQKYDARDPGSPVSCELFAEYLGAGGFVLDIGCGTGKDMLLMQQLGLNTFGIDASLGMTNIASRRGLNVLQADFENKNSLEILWLFYRGYVDGIWSKNALLHTTPKIFESVITMVYKLLRKKGMLFLTMKESSTFAIEEENKVTDSGTKYYCYWPRRILIETVEKIGFDLKMLVMPGKDSFGERNILEMFFIKPQKRLR